MARCGASSRHGFAAGIVLLSTIALSSGCGGETISDFQKQQMTQQEAIDKLKAVGGDVVKKEYQLGEGWVVKLPGATITDQTFEHLRTLERVAELDLSSSTITDAQMPKLAEVAGVLFKLDLGNTSVTDDGIAPLAERGLLLDLNLKGTKATAAGVAQWKAKRNANPSIGKMFKDTKVKI